VRAACITHAPSPLAGSKVLPPAPHCILGWPHTASAGPHWLLHIAHRRAGTCYSKPLPASARQHGAWVSMERAVQRQTTGGRAARHVQMSPNVACPPLPASSFELGKQLGGGALVDAVPEVCRRWEAGGGGSKQGMSGSRRGVLSATCAPAQLPQGTTMQWRAICVHDKHMPSDSWAMRPNMCSNN